MADTPDSAGFFSDDLASAEARMRRSLELAGRPQAHGHRMENRTDRQSGNRPRSRFVQDGEVPVTVVNRVRPQEPGRLGGPDRPGTDALLAGEQAARAKAERALQEAQATIRDLQTKQGHSDLARREATAGQIAQLEAEVATERAARLAAEAALAEAADARRELEAALAAAAPAPKPARKVVAKSTSIRRVREPKPVKWWVKTSR